MSATRKHRSRENVITRAEYDAKHRAGKVRPISPRSEALDAMHDRTITRRAQSNPVVLRTWLERVEGRFMGTPVDISPEDALTMALRITAGEVKYCDQQIARLTEDELFERPLRVVTTELFDGEVSVQETRDAEVITRWQQLRAAAIDRMARYAKMALDVGIEERTAKLREDQAAMIARFFESVMGEIDLTPEQQKILAPTMRRHLELIEGQAIDVT
jgi:hypothetical protein